MKHTKNTHVLRKRSVQQSRESNWNLIFIRWTIISRNKIVKRQLPKWKKYSFQYLIHYTAKSLKITCISAEYPFASIDIYCFIIEIKSITASLLNLNRRRKPSLVIQMDSIDRSISIKIYLFLIYWFSYHLTTTKFPPSL